MARLVAFRITFRLNEVEPEAQFAEASPTAHIFTSCPCAVRKKRSQAEEGFIPDEAFNRLLSAVRIIHLGKYFNLPFKPLKSSSCVHKVALYRKAVDHIILSAMGNLFSRLIRAAVMDKS